MAKQPRSLYGQVVAITGGGRGIGRATAQALVREGAKVALGDVDVATAEQTAAELGGGTIALPLDVTDRASFERFLEDVEEALGPLDVLINNAGIMPLSRFVEEDDATVNRMIDINLHGVITGTRLALLRMERRGRGHIVNIASSAGKTGIPGGATYSATKFAVVGLSEAIAGELYSQGSAIEISVVMPVLVNTELTDGLSTTRGVKRQQPEDVAEAIVDTLKVPHFEVYVPKSIGTINKVAGLLPHGGRMRLSKAFKADRILLEVDEGRRASYELRAAHSTADELEAGDQPAQLGAGEKGS